MGDVYGIMSLSVYLVQPIARYGPGDPSTPHLLDASPDLSVPGAGALYMLEMCPSLPTPAPTSEIMPASAPAPAIIGFWLALIVAVQWLREEVPAPSPLTEEVCNAASRGAPVSTCKMAPMACCRSCSSEMRAFDIALKVSRSNRNGRGGMSSESSSSIMS